jgi:hypothetical protein
MMRWKFVLWVYSLYTLLALSDIILVAGSPRYRNALGRVDVSDMVDLSVRLAPSAFLVFFCASVVVGRQLTRGPWKALVVVSSGLFVVLGVVALVPWIGVFATMLTPIASVSISALLWLSNGYLLSLIVSLGFVSVNAWIIACSLVGARQPEPGKDREPRGRAG